jgi:NADH:ubiquinone oxidoreductase subunit 5 (subunit L)/multisubunit Na+/H+ antiporter MnhA subunit
MMNEAVRAVVLYLPEVMIFCPVVLLALLAGAHLIRPVREEHITRPILWLMSTLSLLAVANVGTVFDQGASTEDLFNWYHIGEVTYSFALINNLGNALFAAGFMVIIAVVGFFAKTYLHREENFAIFFGLYLLFVSFTALVVFSANFDALFVGWESVGICSVLLIAFYRKRFGPLQNSLFTLASYRVGEMAFFGAITMMHILRESTYFPVLAEISVSEHWIIILLLLAIYVKSAQWPFCSWLPRAMEGPTPSSAILYGGISTHFGPLLLLKMIPYLSGYSWLTPTLVVNALITIGYASAVGRTRNEIKTQLAYATIAQLGVIYLEIAFGWYHLALFHCLAHCALRTFQFLKSPSYLHDYRQLQIERAEFFVECLYPEKLRRVLYYAAHRKFFLDHWIEVVLLRPFFAVSRAIIHFEQRWVEGVRNKHELEEATQPLASSPPELEELSCYLP